MRDGISCNLFFVLVESYNIYGDDKLFTLSTTFVISFTISLY